MLIVSATYAGREAVTAWKQHNKGTESDEAAVEVVSAKTMQKLQLIEEIIEENYALDMVDSKTMENGIYQGILILRITLQKRCRSSRKSWMAFIMG